jgi:hypothetical protein
VEVFRNLLEAPEEDGSKTVAAGLLVRLYPSQLGPTDIATFASFLAKGRHRVSSGTLTDLGWRLPRLVPPGEEATILDALAAAIPATDASSSFDLVDSMAHVARDLLIRALPSVEADDAKRLVGWLRWLSAGHLSGQDKELAAAFAARPELFPPLLVAASESAIDDQDRAPHMALYILRAMARWWPWPGDGVDRLLAAGLSEPAPSRREILFSSCVTLCFETARGHESFERVCRVAENTSDLKAILDRESVCKMPERADHWRAEHARRRREHKEEEQRRRAESVDRLRKVLPKIADGTAQSALVFLADVWLGGMARSGDDQLEGLACVEREADADIAAAAAIGLRKIAATDALPSPGDIANLKLRNCEYTGARAWVLGADLLFEDSGEGMPQLPEERLVSLLALALVTPTNFGSTSTKRAWPARIASAVPQAATAALRDLVIPQLEAGQDVVDGLTEVLDDAAFAAIRRELLPEFLACAHRGHAFNSVLNAALRDPGDDDVLPILRRCLAEVGGSLQPTRWPLLATAWLLAPEEFSAAVEAAVATSPELLADLAERTGELGHGFEGGALPALRLPHRLLLAKLCGPAWPPAEWPVGTFTYPHAADFAAFVRRQFEALAADESEEAGKALCAFAEEKAFAAHRDFILHALALRRRDEVRRRWDTPEPAALGAALRAKQPATVADLLAFTEDHLRSLDADLRTTQENRWKGFWDRDVEKPKVENDCRDHLCALLMGRFEAAGLSATVEARVAGDDRCDIKARFLSVTLPVEVKGDWHRELWSAWRTQLGDRYAREPSSAGRGIYLVLWFGRKRLKHPTSGALIDNPRALECALQDLVDAAAYSLRVVVIDGSPPPTAHATQRPAKTKTKAAP